MPDYANPQSLNRYSYVTNNPLRYTDPTGHMMSEGDGGGCGKKCKAYIEQQKGKGKKEKDGGFTPGSTSDTSCQTVTCQAFHGELSAIADLFIPSHVGWRWQLEGSFTPGAVGLGPSGTIGVNVALNRKAKEIAFFGDYSGEGGVGAGNPFGLSITTGPIVGWGSSSVKDVATGNSAIVSATVAPDLALSGSATVPLEGDSIQNARFHVDSVYGQIPATLYLGGGGGTAYGGLGVGGSHVFAAAIAGSSPGSASVIVDPFP